MQLETKRQLKLMGLFTLAVFSMVSVGFATWSTITFSSEELSGLFQADSVVTPAGVTVTNTETFKYGEYFFVTEDNTSSVGKLVYTMQVDPKKLPSSMKTVSGSGYAFRMDAKLKMADSVAIFSSNYVDGCKFDNVATSPSFAADNTYLTFSFVVTTPSTTSVSSFEVEIDFKNALVYEKKSLIEGKNFLLTLTKGVL